LGGNEIERGYGIKRAGNGNLYITGETNSSNIPTTLGAYSRTRSGSYDAFITCITHGGIVDILGTWSTGVWIRNSETGAWVDVAIPALLVDAAELDADGIADDIIGVWNSGLWVKYSATGTWAKLSAAPPTDIAVGDMNGDGRDDILGTWSSGVWYRNTKGKNWVKVSSIPAYSVAAGDIDGDGTDDCVGVWGSGLWVKYSSAGIWRRFSIALPIDVAAGDMNGDGRDDVVGAWSTGTFYWDTLGGSWVQISTPASSVATGEIDGDGTDDLVGNWSSGFWVKHSATGTWEKLSTALPDNFATGLLRTAWGSGSVNLHGPVNGTYMEGPGKGGYEDLSKQAPGGRDFIYRDEGNLIPLETESSAIDRVAGPGESGFQFSKQKNIFPKERRDVIKDWRKTK
jgi:hypothetical protein